MIEFSVLSSSSKANVTYVRTGQEAFLIDCGLSARRIEHRLGDIGAAPDSVSAILLTHEHRDHTNGLSVFSRRYNVPIYCNRATAEHLTNVYEVRHFRTGDTFSHGDAVFNTAPITHDAVDPVSFTITSAGSKLAHVTDLGQVTDEIREHVHGAQAIVIESNYEDDLLQTCEYPWPLKQRISSSHGHLSNRDAATFIAESLHDDLQLIVLAHLSKNSNTPEQAEQTFLQHCPLDDHQELHVASEFYATPLLRFHAQGHKTSDEPLLVANG